MIASVALAAEYGNVKSYPSPSGSRRPPSAYKPSKVVVEQEQQVFQQEIQQQPIKGVHLDEVQAVNPVYAAVQSKRYIELIPYANQYHQLQPQVVEVDTYTAPVKFVFRSVSGPISFQQTHISAPPQDVQHVRSEELTQHLSHEIYKPVVQELREVIQPYRQVIQEIKPVVEEVRTIVAHGDKVKVPEATKKYPKKQKEVQQQQQPTQQQEQELEQKTESVK